MKKEVYFEQKDYQKKSTFASFLPGIAGRKGIPIWCHYVNRGQAIASFGVLDKDHSIMEYAPAHQSYQNVERMGFRTFLKKKEGESDIYIEAFQDLSNATSMRIYDNMLILQTVLKENLIVTVTYFTLPEEPFGALVRQVAIKNTDQKEIELEILDGMAAVIPYGVSLDSIKSMGQTAKAWMQVEEMAGNTPYFRVRASMDDTADVREIEGGNFGYGCLASGEKMEHFVDPIQIFSYDTAYNMAVGFQVGSIEELKREKQRMQNQLPCCFFGTKQKIRPQEEVTFYELFGQVEEPELLQQFTSRVKNESYFETKKVKALELTAHISQNMYTKTANPTFDAYCGYTYMDNCLRGGFPIPLTEHKNFYIYSRKHGDLERDYNFFRVLPEYYSQGNGNFRDVNQNRRCDTFFAPFLKQDNMKLFYSFLQMDGYNPLGIEKMTYRLSEASFEQIKEKLEPTTQRKWEEYKQILTEEFTPGKLYQLLENIKKEEQIEPLFEEILEESTQLNNGVFGEGYWSDHWTYNLDLLEEYLEIYPEKEEDMLYEEAYSYFYPRAHVIERKERYEKTKKGIRQYHFLRKEDVKPQKEKEVLVGGSAYKGTLFEKLILLSAVKFATLDSYGMGIEMEGGKPGWYDALNGLPGMFGSSMAETYELLRMVNYTLKAALTYEKEVYVFEELYEFIEQLQENIQKEELWEGTKESLKFWNANNDAKEAYRRKIYKQILGKKKQIKKEELVSFLQGMKKVLVHGIQKAKQMSEQIPTYFTFEMTDYECKDRFIIPKGFEAHALAPFLEGAVRYLKLDDSMEEKKAVYEKIKHSDLYDEKLSMYKVNASLKDESYELGRARAFTPGWLENESIWLHMEYKYLLELLKSGLYESFFEDFSHAAVPFLKEEVYGRSLFENSSFIASSKNPDEQIHGKGFVARLSGSTVEFISMWKHMMFGANYFAWRENELVFTPTPAIPAYLIPMEKEISATFMGKINVTYRMKEQKNYIPQEYQITRMTFYTKEETYEVKGGVARKEIAEKIRALLVDKIVIEME